MRDFPLKHVSLGKHVRLVVAVFLVLNLSSSGTAQQTPPKISGTYPHLAHTNQENEVGIGAVVPWANSLWTNTYGPHLPYGSSDKLRRIDRDWNVIEHPESVGGTPANRMIHIESQQLLLGHHLIDNQGKVRTIDPRKAMPGRITANTRHLTDPKNKVYYFTMENGVYEVDVKTLEVTAIIRDPISISKTHLPGYHGKGAYTGSNRVVVSNNGEPNKTSPSGCLATWDGKDWTIVARNQFVEVTGPGGLKGNDESDDRVWATGWDAKSVRLFLLEDGEWFKFRLPKGSYSHDANHGWNTEWPRIRQVKDDLTLMHMHGLFFEFPQSFSKSNFGGLKPVATYLKMPVDYAWFNDQLVIAKDDASKFDNDFVAQAQSNLWIGDYEELKNWGPKIGFGGVWLNDSFDAGEISEPFFVGGFERLNLHLVHHGGFPCRIELQVDREGTGDWKTLETVRIDGKSGYASFIAPSHNSQWVRLVSTDAADDLTAYFQLSTLSVERDEDDRFTDLSAVTEQAPGGATLQLPRGLDMKLNVFTSSGQYQVKGDLSTEQIESSDADEEVRESIAIQNDQRLGVDDASAFVQFIDSRGRQVKLRLPKGDPAFDSTVGKVRHIREVVTERSMVNLHGTFYELPRPKPGRFINFWQMKPISSHNKHVHDYCSWRGMLVLSGAKLKSDKVNHVTAGDTGLWLGEVDDLWSLGKPSGFGGPWKKTLVKKDQASDPYLMLGYEQKTLVLEHDQEEAVEFEVQVDFLGTGDFATYKVIRVQPGQKFQHRFEEGFSAHWVRLVANPDARVTAQFTYE